MANRLNVSPLPLVKSCEPRHFVKPADLALTWWARNFSEMKDFLNDEDEYN